MTVLTAVNITGESSEYTCVSINDCIHVKWGATDEGTDLQTSTTLPTDIYTGLLLPGSDSYFRRPCTL